MAGARAPSGTISQMESKPHLELVLVSLESPIGLMTAPFRGIWTRSPAVFLCQLMLMRPAKHFLFLSDGLMTVMGARRSGIQVLYSAFGTLLIRSKALLEHLFHPQSLKMSGWLFFRVSQSISTISLVPLMPANTITGVPGPAANALMYCLKLRFDGFWPPVQMYPSPFGASRASDILFIDFTCSATNSAWNSESSCSSLSSSTRLWSKDTDASTDADNKSARTTTKTGLLDMIINN